MKKLLILDCDWVLYKFDELDVNAMIYAFNDVCDELNCTEYKFTRIEHCTEDKPVKWFYNYIAYISNLLSINMNDFIDKMVSKIDYSNIKLDTEWILETLKSKDFNYKICICTNNHKKHINKILKAKFDLTLDNFPYPCFDVDYAKSWWVYYSKQSPEFVSKLEKQFNIKSSNFIWIDDTPTVLEKISIYWWLCILVDKNNTLLNILKSLY